MQAKFLGVKLFSHGKGESFFSPQMNLQEADPKLTNSS